MIFAHAVRRVRGVRFPWPHALVWLALVGLWQAWIWVGRPPEFVAPSPAEVAVQLLHPGWLLKPLLVTIGTALLGSVIGVILGAVLAILCWLVPAGRVVILPPVVVLCAVPLVVFLPIIGLMVGYGNFTVVTMTVVITLLPTLVFLDTGLRALPRHGLDLMKVLGARRHSVLLHLALPSCVPSLAVALRITSGAAILAAFTADFLVGSDGLGHLVAYEEYFLQTPRIWGACIVVIAFSVVLYLGVSMVATWLADRFAGPTEA
jgi:ABC-type nitrate/sulfonate/bicarbonate transport system permease component